MKTSHNFVDISSKSDEPALDAEASSTYPGSGTFKSKTDHCQACENCGSSNRYKNGEPSSDFFQHLNTKHPTSFWGTIFHLIFLSAGSTVLLIPNAFMATGLIGGTITMLLIFSFYVHCMRMLLWSAQQICQLKRVTHMSYADLVYETFDTGPPFARSLACTAWLLISCVFCLAWYGSCVLILVLIADNLQTICSSWLNLDLQMNGIVLLLFIPVLILNLIRKLKFLEPCSVLGFIFNSIAILMVLYYSITDPAPWRGQNQLVSWDSVPLLVGIIFVNINVTGLIISFKNEMEHPEKFETPLGVMTISYSTIFTMFFIFSIFFGMKYGTSVPPNALAVIPSHSLLYFIAIIFYVIGLYLLFPLILYVPLNVILKALYSKHKELMRYKVVCEYALRTFLIALAVFLAYLNPNINFFVTLFGTVGTSIDSIIYPCMVHSLVVWKVCAGSKTTIFILLKNFILIILGLGLIVGAIQNSFSHL